MTSIPVAFRSNPGKYTYSGAPRLLNAYAEQQGKDGVQPMVLLPAFGMVQFSAVTDTPCRGLIFLEDLDLIYSFHSSGAFKVTSAGVATRIGTIPGNDVVQLSRNRADPPQISVHCSAGEFYIQGDIVYTVMDGDLISDIVSQDHIAGYTVYGSETGEFQISSLNECQTVDGLDVAEAEQSADKLVKVVGDRGDLLIFGQITTEPWRNTGQADFPFEPMSGSTLQKGLLSSNAVVKSDNTLIWPGHDNTIYRLNGYQPQRVSTHAIERLIQGETTPSGIIGFGHFGEGHSFSTFSGTNWTRSFDAATQLWHERESYQLGYWRAKFAVNAFGKQIVGDVLSGSLFYLADGVFTESGDPIIWGMDSPTLNVFPNGGIVDAVFLDVATGVGTIPATGQGYDPILMLSWSTDGGATFEGDRHLKLGKFGDRVRVVARRLGRFGPAGIIFRVRVSDPVIRSLIAIDVVVRPLKK